MSKTFTIHFVPYQTQRPEFEGQPVSINNIAYISAPSWHIPQDKLTMARNISTPATIPFNNINLAALNDWHVLNASSFYSTNIPSRYNYTFDATGGLASTSINDGGFDMYDSGNFFNISTTRGTANILTVNSNVYGRISTLTGSNVGFMTTSRNVWPQVSLAYAQEANILWRITGGIGTDGGGSLSNVSSTYTTPRGYTGRFWANLGFGTSDPTICYTWFTIESTDWNTLISSSNIGMARTLAPPDPMNQFVRVDGCNFMFGVFLLSSRRTTPSPNGFFISTSFIENFLSNYVQNANIILT
jgi:hypothetical protein